MGSVAQPSTAPSGGLDGFLGGNGGAALSDTNQSGATLKAAIISALISFGAQFAAFCLLRWRLTRIYRPKTFLVAERQRVPIPQSGPYQWILPLFTMPNSTVISKCGLDAYFFLRYLRMLLKIFVPMAAIILPILLPINKYSGPPPANTTVSGVNVLGWQHIGPTHYRRTWAHLILAILVVVWVCYVIYQELRGYIRIRQAYLTSPRHRIRASATTVLVRGIPRKWLSVEALNGLYDVFPGGIRNIWINRDFDELLEKVELRDKIAKKLESAETTLIKNCVKKHRQAEEKKAKEDGVKMTKEQKKDYMAQEDAKANRVAESQGVSSGDPHQMSKNIHDAAANPEAEDDPELREDQRSGHVLARNPLKFVGQGVGAIGYGLSALGKKGKGIVGEVTGDITTGITKTDAVLSSVNRDELRHQDTQVDNEYTEQDAQNGGAKGFLARTATKVKAYKKEAPIAFPSPQPNLVEMGEYPLTDLARTHTNATDRPEPRMASSKWAEALRKTQFWRKKTEDEIEPDYPVAINEDYTEDQDGEPEWLKYIKAKDRETIRLSDTGLLSHLPFMGRKVDKIYHLRKELARLNAEIEYDQADAERFPLMNSAFIQFNHQVAAHMACQSVSHHIPHHMAPRIVEISPSDIIWTNMSIKWWEAYVRTGLVIVVSIALIVLFAIPVSFTGALSQISTAAHKFHWLAWLARSPTVVISIIQGVLPPILLSLLLILVPIIYRALVKQQGVPTGTDQELGVQQYYFLFLFIQVFLVVSVSSSLTSLFTSLYNSPTGILSLLALDLPRAANYFFSYMIVQSLSNSAGALLQLGTLIFAFVLGPMLDSTARQKWRRQTELQNVQWGSYFPPFTNFAVIGIIFSIISPLILVFNLITFFLFWIVQRYNVLYVYLFSTDTGGLLFPKAVDQLFAGLYVMELCLLGLFIIARDSAGEAPCIPQAIIMAVALVSTVIYQLLLNSSFKPLLRYLPITLEDDAVIRDEEFARAQASKWHSLTQEEPDEREKEDIEDQLEHKEKREEEEEEAAKQAEKDRIRAHRGSRGHSRSTSRGNHLSTQTKSKSGSWKRNTIRRVTQSRGRSTEASTTTATDPGLTENGYSVESNGESPTRRKAREERRQRELESQQMAGDVLFSGFSDELEDLTPEERDTLVRYSFQHEALRARRPVIWLPRDPLGISEDEIARSQLMSTVETYIWMSNDGTALDGKGKVVFRKSPPDFASVDLIEL
ncbi:hypothetical protein ANO11243_054610 [Dothideomycetidae sp. 11243]|nr:hypothetical protein ANO11243_054610 [fungal sp. No.11243]